MTEKEPSKVPFGKELAESVAKHLMSCKSHAMANNHRDYCGIGLSYDPKTDKFDVCEVHDGYCMETTKNSKSESLSFKGKDAFVSFLAAQSDYSLSGLQPDTLSLSPSWAIKNQTITGQFLKANKKNE